MFVDNAQTCARAWCSRLFRRKEPEMAGSKAKAKGKKNKVVGGVKKEACRVTKNLKL